MFRSLLRFFGFVLLAAAFATLIVDGTRSIAAQHPMPFSVEETMGWMWPARLAEVRAAATRVPSPLGEILHGALGLPTSVVLACVALLLLVAGRTRAAAIGLPERS